MELIYRKKIPIFLHLTNYPDLQKTKIVPHEEVLTIGFTRSKAANQKSASATTPWRRQIAGFAAALSLFFCTELTAYDIEEELIISKETFPKDFTSGVLGASVDCEHIAFYEDGTFIYKFTGDCKGWGRKLKGKWTKEKEKLILSATLKEDTAEGNKGCAGSYYHTNTKAERKQCFKKYKAEILKNFKVFPAIFKLTGGVWVTDSSTIAVSMKSYLINSKKKDKVKGLMHFDDEKFGSFYVLKDRKNR